MILLAGGFATGGSMPAPSMWDLNAILSGAVAGIIVTLVLVILWGAGCYWVRVCRGTWQ